MGPSSTRARKRERLISWVFVVVQVLLIAAVFLMPASDSWTLAEWVSTGALALQAAGVVILLVGAATLGRSLTPLPTPVADGTLKTGGLYRFVRHPIYTGLMALVVGEAVRERSILVAPAAAALIGWLTIKARWEERKLTERYDAYRAYASQTPRFIPFWPGGRTRPD
jgi:protein-S-isoprenylcysteine O-methyltransferase Ste14